MDIVNNKNIAIFVVYSIEDNRVIRTYVTPYPFLLLKYEKLLFNIMCPLYVVRV